MFYFIKFFYRLFVLIAILYSTITWANPSVNIPILCYHNLNPTIRGSMNLTPQKFEEQIKFIKNHGFTIITLKDAVAYLQGKRMSLPPKPIVITVDDGWQSVYKYMLPIIKKYTIPVTLFIYPETISNGKNALTWAELKELQNTGLFTIEDHTYSHPNFKVMKRKLSAPSYDNFVNKELISSKQILENKLGTQVSFLAWPFGIYNSDLEQSAKKAGFTMAFTIDGRRASRLDRPMAVPRFMIIDAESMSTFGALIGAK